MAIQENEMKQLFLNKRSGIIANSKEEHEMIVDDVNVKIKFNGKK